MSSNLIELVGFNPDLKCLFIESSEIPNLFAVFANIADKLRIKAEFSQIFQVYNQRILSSVVISFGYLNTLFQTCFRGNKCIS